MRAPALTTEIRNPHFANGRNRYLVLCPTHRDTRELAKLNVKQAEFLFHDYASLQLENLVGTDGVREHIGDPLNEIETIIERFKNADLCGVISTDDYPGSTLACVIAPRFGLVAPDPAINLISQHKYYSRLIQKKLIPEAVPRFELIDVEDSGETPRVVGLPAFVKPVKSFFSIGAQEVSCRNELDRVRAQWAKLGVFFSPFEQLLDRYAGLRIGTKYLIAETPLHGRQFTVEGYTFGDEIVILGIVDSILFPGTLAFERFEYPSSLPGRVQERMIAFTKSLIKGLGYRNGMFNVEFMYDAAADRMYSIEINPRMASQFADLFEKVDGTNTYTVLLAIAAKRKPQISRRRGAYRFAASCVLRCFEDRYVAAVPSILEMELIEARHPGVRIEILATAGKLLSQEMQDGNSYRYGIINVGGNDRQDALRSLADCENSLSFIFAPTEAAACTANFIR